MNESQQQQEQPSVDGIVHGEDTSKVVDSDAVDGSAKEEVSADLPAREGVAEKEKTNTEQQEVNQPAVEPSEETPIDSHAGGQGVLVSSDETPAEDVVETQEKQLPTSSGQEQTENQPTEGSTTVEVENKDEP